MCIYTVNKLPFYPQVCFVANQDKWKTKNQTGQQSTSNSENKSKTIFFKQYWTRYYYLLIFNTLRAKIHVTESAIDQF